MAASMWLGGLTEFQESVAAAQPAPAGVATATVAAALGLSLLIKVLRITGKHGDLLEPAMQLLHELRSIADADVEAVYAYLRSRETKGLREVPESAARAVYRALELCSKMDVKGLIRADIEAAEALLRGSAAAIAACVAANSKSA